MKKYTRKRKNRITGRTELYNSYSGAWENVMFGWLIATMIDDDATRQYYHSESPAYHSRDTIVGQSDAGWPVTDYSSGLGSGSPSYSSNYDSGSSFTSSDF